MRDKRIHECVYAFPALFEIDEEDNNRICVSFPDLENCFTDGATVAVALTAAKEALENVLYWMERQQQPIPNPSDIRSLKTEKGQFTSLVAADMASARRAWENRSISRTITLPAWLDELARKNNINVSQTLQQALKVQFGVEQNAKYA